MPLMDADPAMGRRVAPTASFTVGCILDPTPVMLPSVGPGVECGQPGTLLAIGVEHPTAFLAGADCVLGPPPAALPSSGLLSGYTIVTVAALLVGVEPTLDQPEVLSTSGSGIRSVDCPSNAVVLELCTPGADGDGKLLRWTGALGGRDAIVSASVEPLVSVSVFCSVLPTPRVC